MSQLGVAPEQFASVCVVVDKSDKLPREKVVEELAELGVAPDTADGILEAMKVGRGGGRMREIVSRACARPA